MEWITTIMNKKSRQTRPVSSGATLRGVGLNFWPTREIGYYISLHIVNLQIFPTVLFLLYLLMGQIRWIKTVVIFCYSTNDKEEDAYGLAKIKCSEHFVIGKLAQIKIS